MSPNQIYAIFVIFIFYEKKVVANMRKTFGKSSHCATDRTNSQFPVQMLCDRAII